MRFRRAPALGLLVALLAAAPASRAAAPEPSPAPGSTPPAPHKTITVDGSCPDAEAIWAAVASIVPVDDRDRFAVSAKIEVSDLGDSYRVAVSTGGVDRVRVYRDAAHDCDHRARFAAVFIVLTLMPPDVLLDALPAPSPEPPPPPRPAPPPPPPPPPPPAPRPRRLRIELAALADVAPRSTTPWPYVLGGELRLAPGPGRLGIAGAVGVAVGALDFGTLQATELRVPFDLGVRLPLVARAATDLVGDLGLAGAVFHDTGKNTANPQSGTRVDLGGRAGLVLHHGRPGDRLLELAGLHAVVFPRPYDVTLTPQGTVGHTPAFWVGVTLGLAVQP